ncbi:TerB family tellurite resistance protein [Pontibacter sp. HSC-14F20]|uniref:TerB family tellurite resistance protein n=1 Tax=Pontibacter sp. HSC-14F20 TaxID=2864136 RepID=UPI001C7365D9|nr:TerB family tellurite resistance protein [Pontibacter sp. HSC-14F20]MBX0334213.1 TerB family tellurite resistance protein [Pontibacter sp. HSC-14F20]
MEGVFNTTGRTNIPDSYTYTPQNEQEAWIAIMHACVAVDDDVADEELDEMAQTMADRALFEGHDIMAYSRNVFYAHVQLGSKLLIDNSVDLISEENRPTLFAHTIQLVLSDSVVSEKEEELIRYLSSALDMDEKEAHEIVRDVLNSNKDKMHP